MAQTQISTTHPSYNERIFDWKMCETAYEGQTAVKREATVWLPRLSAMDDSDYANYLDRALYYAVFSRTVHGLAGALTFKVPTISGGDEAFRKRMQTIGSGGESIYKLTNMFARSYIKMGRGGLLVDSSDQAEPFLVVYDAQSIINWKRARVDGKMVFTMVVLREMVEDPNLDNEYQTKYITQYRKLFLDTDESGRHVYRYEVYQETRSSGRDGRAQDMSKEPNSDTTYMLVASGTPTNKTGLPFSYIPFRVEDGEGDPGVVGKPFLLDMVHVSRSHFLNSADLEWGRHFTALPTAWAAGFNPDVAFKIGSPRAWVTEVPNAKAAYLEFTGAGLGHLANGMADKERKMAVLGARLLEESPRHMESEGTAKIRQSGEHSTLVDIGQAISELMTWGLRTIQEWRAEGTEPITYKLLTDFNFRNITSDEIATLMLAVQQGRLSYNAFFANLQRGGVIPDGVTMEQELALIEAGGMADNTADTTTSTVENKTVEGAARNTPKTRL